MNLERPASQMSRNAVCKRIRTALRHRSGKTWSVTGGRGTAYGWITIDAPPARRKFDADGQPTSGQGGYMSAEDREELRALLGLSTHTYSVGRQGVSIPASTDYYDEYIARAEGRTPPVHGAPYWD